MADISYNCLFIFHIYSELFEDFEVFKVSLLDQNSYNGIGSDGLL